MFRFEQNILKCEGLELKTLTKELKEKYGDFGTPFYVYSGGQVERNVQQYKNAFRDHHLNFSIGYAMKANHNFHLLKLIKSFGCFVVTVSGYEVKLALKAGFDGTSIIYNGNGKYGWEIDYAINNGCYLNVDSVFDAVNVSDSVNRLKKESNVLIRVNPALDAKVHPFNSTALADSKFGVELTQMSKVTDVLQNNSLIKLVGLHCHIGSTISDVSIYRDVAKVFLELAEKLTGSGFCNLKYLNFGGGLGISYQKNEDEAPTAEQLVAMIAPLIRNTKFTILVEPGRSLIGNAGMLITGVIGKKSNGQKHFIVVDAAMTELIRPALYSAYHHITTLVEDPRTDSLKVQSYDIVGPVCESGDFLAKDRKLTVEEASDGLESDGPLLAVWDTGAYCASMGSNYNMRARPMEILVCGSSWKVIRKRETFEDMIRSYDI